jgi:hypothetical protein
MAFQYVLPHAVTSQLDSLRRRIRRVAFLRGCGLFLILSCVLLITSMTTDFLLDLEPGPRVVGFVGFCIAEVGLFALLLIRPFVIRLKDAEVATLAEEHFPELGERVSSLVELSDPEIPEGEKGSPLMRELLEEETVNELARCDFNEAVSVRPAIRRLSYGMGTVSFLILTLLIFPSVSSLLLARLFKPWGNYESVSRLIFDIEGADEFVGRGSDIDIAARMSWRSGSDEPIPEPVELSWKSDDGNSDVRPLRFDPDLNAFTTAIPNAQDSLDFFVSSAGSRSRRYRINVLDRPEVLTAKLEITPPGYLGRPRETIDGITGEITIFEHSHLSFELTFTQPVEESAIDWIAPLVLADSELAGDRQETRPEKDDGENFVRNEGSYTNELVPVDSLPMTSLILSEDRLSATLQVPAEIQGAFAFRLTEEHGLENNTEPHRQFIITRDQPPMLDVPGSKQDRARPTDVYALRVSAVDDVALEELELHVTSREGLDRVLKAPAELLGQESMDYEFRIDLADVAVESGDFLKLQVRATDGRPVPAANEIWSEARYVAISDTASAQGASDVLARQQEIRQEIQDIRDRLREAVTQSDQLKQDAQKSLDNDRRFAQQNKVETLADREAELAVRIAELAEQFSQHPLFANLSDDLWKMAAEQLDPAAMLLGGSIEMEPEAQIATIDENSTVADMVEEQLADVAANFEKLADLEKDLLELGRIAQRANQLADDAVQLDESREELANAAPLEGESNEDRQAASEQLADNEQQLIEEQSQLLAALDNLLQQRPELIESARDHQLERLAELAARASQIAEPQEMLAESLQNDAEQSSQAAAPLAERQQEITQQIEELAARANAQQARQPVTPIDPELARQIADELQQGNLDQAEKLSEQAQDDLAQLAKELLENAKLPEDPKEAAAELAQRQQDLADELEAAAAAAASKEQPAGAAGDRPADAAIATDEDAATADTGKLAARQAALQMATAQLQADPESRDEQREAVEQAAEALQKLIEAAKQEDTAKQPDALNRAAEEGREAAAALEELAEAILPADQQQAEALEELQRLRKEDGKEGELSEEDLAQRLRELLEPPRPEPQEVAQQARQLAQSQEQLREETETLDDEFASPADDPAATNPAGADSAEQSPAAQNAPAENPAAENAAEAEAARPLAQQQAALNEQAQNLPPELGALERAEALAQLEQAQAALEQGQLQAAAEAQQQAQQALENFAREAEALAQSQDPALAQAPGQTPGEAASTPPAQPGEQPAAGEPGQTSEQLAARAEELAALQQELQQAIAELAGQPADADPVGNEAAGAAEAQAGQPGNSPPAGAEPAGAESPAGTQPAAGQQPAAGTPIAELLAQQEELTARAAQLALQTAQQTGAESPAAQSTTESAQQSAQAETAAQGGQFGEAASQAAAAQQAASAAAQSLDEASPALAGQAQRLAEQQQQMAAAFEQLENSPIERAAAQQAQQEQLAAQADEVAQALEELAAQLGSEPLNLDEQGQQAATAQQSAQQGQQAAGQAAQSMQAGNQGQAAQAAAQAAESLRESAQQAGANAAAASEGASGEASPIPGEFAAQVADAMRQLQEAQQQLAEAAAQAAQSGQPSGEATGQPGSEPGQPGSEPGQPGQTNLNAETGEAAGGEPVAGQPAPGESAGDEASSGQPSPNGPPSGTPSNSPASGQPGQSSQNSALAEAAAALKEAAEMLSDAAQQLAADGDDQQQGNQPPSNAPPGLGNSGTGAFADNGAGGPLNTELKRRAMKNWGKLSGQLKTEILQSSQRKANGDYAKLIKLYFEELGKAGQASDARE